MALVKQATMRACKTRIFENTLQTFKLPGLSLHDMERKIGHRLVLNRQGGEPISATYAGSILAINYRLEIELSMEGCCSGSAVI